jgi:hypothetical protein
VIFRYGAEREQRNFLLHPLQFRRHRICPFYEVRKGGLFMKKTLYTLVMLAGLAQWGCSPEFWGGAAVGALGAGGGYEYNAKRQMDRLDDDRKSGRISRDEYEDRKRQIERGSIIY